MTREQTDPGVQPPELPLDLLTNAPEAADEQSSAPKPAARSHGRFERTKQKKKKRTVPPPEPPTEDEDEDEDPDPGKPHPILRALLCILLVLATLASLTVLGADQWLQYHGNRGKEQLREDFDNAQIVVPEDNGRVIAYDDGKTVTYNGQKYRLNENIVTVLFMGVDKKDLAGTEIYGNGGQADVVLVLALDVETGETKLLNISRDTYAEMVLYSGGGVDLGYHRLQLCLAYAYGDGREESCENMVATVSKLLYGMPISAYLAVDMDGVLVANDTVGGVTVTALEDMKMPDGKRVKAGDEITLRGKNCELYIRSRSDEMDANGPRMARQLQYVQAFAGTLTQQARQDFGLITRLYDAITPYIVSSLDLSDTVFLAQTYLDHGLALNVRSIDGSYDWLEKEDGTRNAVYYLDETSLFEAVLDLYYTPISD